MSTPNIPATIPASATSRTAMQGNEQPPSKFYQSVEVIGRSLLGVCGYEGMHAFLEFTKDPNDTPGLMQSIGESLLPVLAALAAITLPIHTLGNHNHQD